MRSLYAMLSLSDNQQIRLISGFVCPSYTDLDTCESDHNCDLQKIRVYH